MTLSRWSALSTAVQRFIDALEETPQIEHLGLVSYAGGFNGASSYTACSYTSNTSDINCQLAEDLAQVTSAMANLSTKKWNGRTNIAAGITKAIQVLTSASARPYTAKTIVLMSDGAANEPGGTETAGRQAASVPTASNSAHTIASDNRSVGSTAYSRFRMTRVRPSASARPMVRGRVLMRR